MIFVETSDGMTFIDSRNEGYGKSWYSEPVDLKFLQKLMGCFKRSFINANIEFIAHEKANEYFSLRDCHIKMDVYCKVLEWFSRGSYKTEPFGTDKKNEEFHNFMRSGVNAFLGTNFTETDMEEIYTYLGNRCNHDRTIRFVLSGYDMEVLKEVHNENITRNQGEP